MKVQSINSNQTQSFQGANKMCKVGVGALIAGTTLFMASNAVDSFTNEISQEKIEKIQHNVDIVASLLGIFGTATSIIGIKQPDYENNFKHL